MNQLLSKNEWCAFDRALQATQSGKTEQKPVELRLSGTHTHSAPFLNATNQFGAKLVQFAVKPVPVPESSARPGGMESSRRKGLAPDQYVGACPDRQTDSHFGGTCSKSVVSKKILAAMASDPDPAASLAHIRKLLVGPTRNLHDAMFEEFITILEESDHEVQRSLRSLNRQCAHLSDLTNQLTSSSVKSKDEARNQADYFRKELRKSAIAHQEMLSEMFLAIDSKIEELTTQVRLRTEALAKKIETHILEETAGREHRMRELENKCLASSKKAAELIEARVALLEGKSSRNEDALNEVFSSGFSTIAERLKVLGNPSPKR